MRYVPFVHLGRCMCGSDFADILKSSALIVALWVRVLLSMFPEDKASKTL